MFRCCLESYQGHFKFIESLIKCFVIVLKDGSLTLYYFSGFSHIDALQFRRQPSRGVHAAQALPGNSLSKPVDPSIERLVRI